MKKLTTLLCALAGSYSFSQSVDSLPLITHQKELFPYSTELQISIPYRYSWSNREFNLNDTLLRNNDKVPRYLFYQDILDVYYQNFHGLVGPIIEPNLFPKNEYLNVKVKRFDNRQIRYGLYYDWGDDYKKRQEEKIQKKKDLIDSLYKKEEKTSNN